MKWATDFDQWAAPAGITRTHIADLIAKPDHIEIIHASGLTLRLFTKRIPQSRPPAIVFAMVTVADEETVSYPLKVFEGFLSAESEFTPLALLREITDVFGCEVIMGKTKAKLLINHIEPVEPPDFQHDLGVSGPKTLKLLPPVFILAQEEALSAVRCLLAFCLDVTKYSVYHKSRKPR